MYQSNEGRMTPQQHAEHISHMLYEAQQECRIDIARVNDPKAQALFETVAEMIGGIRKALEGYHARNEPIWQGSRSYMTPPRGRDMPPVSGRGD